MQKIFKIMNVNSQKKKFEFVFRLIKEGGKKDERKIHISAMTESEALIQAVEAAKKKFTDAIEIQYTGKFRIN